VQSDLFDNSVSLAGSGISLGSDAIGGSSVDGLSGPFISSRQLQFSPSVDSSPVVLSDPIVLSECCTNSQSREFSNLPAESAVPSYSTRFPFSEVNSCSVFLAESNSIHVSLVLSGSQLISDSESIVESSAGTSSIGMRSSSSMNASLPFVSSEWDILSERLTNSQLHNVSNIAGSTESLDKSMAVLNSDFGHNSSHFGQSDSLHVSIVLSGSHLMSDSESIIGSNVGTSSIGMGRSSSMDASLSFASSQSIIVSKLFMNSGRYRISHLVSVTRGCDDSIEFLKSELGWKSRTFGGPSFLPISVIRLSSNDGGTPVLDKSRDLILSNFAVNSMIFSHSHQPLLSGVISESSYGRGSDSLSGSLFLALSYGMSASDPDAESGRFGLSARFYGSDVMVVTKLSMNSMKCSFSNAAELTLREHSHRFCLSESVSVSDCVSNSNFITLSIALQGSDRTNENNSQVDSVNFISARFKLSSLDGGNVSLLVIDLLKSDCHRLSEADFEFGLRSSESVLESGRPGRSNHLSPSGFALLSGAGPIVQPSGRFRFSCSLSVSRQLSPSDLLVISGILDRNSLKHSESPEAADSTVLVESFRHRHSDLALRSSRFGSLIRADSSFVNLSCQVESSPSYPRVSLPFVASDVLRSTFRFVSLGGDLVMSAPGRAAATVSFGASDWNSISDSFSVSSALSEPADAHGSRLASIVGLIFAVLAAILFLLLLGCCVIWLVRKRRQTTDESDMDYAIEIEDKEVYLPMEDCESNDDMFATFENPESSGNGLSDSVDEEDVNPE
jgi:hypothetical protein